MWPHIWYDILNYLNIHSIIKKNAIDLAGIQFKVLNKSKGPAVYVSSIN
jgi:tRNA U34 5-carboxymethylaminomethyl modifying enzyme MnmG/GidA